MAKIKAISDDAYSILQNAAQFSAKYFQSFIGSNHIFLSLFNFFKVHKDDERYAQVRDKLKEILNEYGITGKVFEETFLIYCPKGEKPQEGETFEATTDSDFLAILDNLKRRAAQEKRTMEVEDLITELFADRSYAIATLLAQIVGSDPKGDELREKIVKAFKKAKAKEIKEFDKLPELNNLNKWVKEHPQVVIGADNDVAKLEMALAGRSVKNAILTGPAGTGKTTVVYELAQRINSGNVPEFLKDKVIYELDTNALVAGTRYRGDMEEKLLNVLLIAKAHPEAILFVDECHTLMGLGKGSEDSGGASDTLKPYITRGEIQMIMCTTDDEYTKYISDDKAFERRFHKILISEPTKENLKKILEGILPVETEYFKKSIQLGLLDEVITLSNKYTLDQANPAKSINMLELACAYARVFEEHKETVDLHEVMESVKLKYDLHITETKLEDTNEELHSVLLGQDPALAQVMRNMTVVEKGLYDPEKPMFSMLFAGPTGTGKTETARIIAKKYFGSENNLIKINMGEYSSEMDVSKLTGSSAGYIGYDDQPELIKKIRQYPNSVVLFDEVEKAHKSVWKVLLSILDEGEMKDNKGNRVSFRNAIIIFTTNLGCTKDAGKATGMGFVKTTKSTDNQSADIMKAVEDYFSPEFLGRLDDIVMYKRLPRTIIETLIERYRKFFEEVSGLPIKFSKKDIDAIVENAEIETAGARGLKRAVRKQIIESNKTTAGAKK